MSEEIINYEIKPALYLFDNDQTYDLLFTRLYRSYFLFRAMPDNAFVFGSVLIDRYTVDNFFWADGWSTSMYNLAKQISRGELLDDSSLNGVDSGFDRRNPYSLPYTINLPKFPSYVSFVVPKQSVVILTWLRTESLGVVKGTSYQTTIVSKTYKVFAAGSEDLKATLPLVGVLFNSLVINGQVSDIKYLDLSEANLSSQLVLYQDLEITIRNILLQLKVPSTIEGLINYNIKREFVIENDNSGWLNSTTTSEQPHYQHLPDWIYSASLVYANNNFASNSILAPTNDLGRKPVVNQDDEEFFSVSIGYVPIEWGDHPDLSYPVPNAFGFVTDKVYKNGSHIAENEQDPYSYDYFSTGIISGRLVYGNPSIPYVSPSPLRVAGGAGVDSPWGSVQVGGAGVQGGEYVSPSAFSSTDVFINCLKRSSISSNSNYFESSDTLVNFFTIVYDYSETNSGFTQDLFTSPNPNDDTSVKNILGPLFLASTTAFSRKATVVSNTRRLSSILSQGNEVISVQQMSQVVSVVAQKNDTRTLTSGNQANYYAPLAYSYSYSEVNTVRRSFWATDPTIGLPSVVNVDGDPMSLTSFKNIIKELDPDTDNGDIMPDSEKVKEIHAALNAGQYGKNPITPSQERKWNLGAMIHAIAVSQGLNLNAEGKMMAPDNYVKYEDGDSVYNRYGEGQAGIAWNDKDSKGGDYKESVPFVGYLYDVITPQFGTNQFTGANSDINTGGMIGCPSIPQFLDAFKMDVMKTLGGDQSVGVVPSADGKSYAVYEGLADLLAENVYMQSYGSLLAIKTFVNSQKGVGMLQEVLKGLGVSIEPKVFELSLEGKVVKGAYPGIAASSPTLADLVLLGLVQLGYLMPHTMSQPSPTPKGDAA